MDIQQLRYFNTVVHFENISKAADHLHISQSALSKQIQRLENELGSPLFDRKGKKIVLNKAGMRFYSSSEQILREFISARDDLDMIVSKKTSRIRIGSAAMPREMLECIGSFALTHKDVIFTLNNRIDFETNIDINRYDALICPEEFRFEKLNGYHLCEENYYFAVSKKSPLASEAAFSANMLHGYPLVFLQGEDMVPEYTYNICSASGIDAQPLFFVDTRDAHHRMISSGIAAGFVPTTESESYETDPNIKLLRILDPRFIRPMKICFLRENHLSDLGLSFRSYVIDYFGLE